MSAPILFDHVGYAYGTSSTRALDDMTFSVDEGSLVAVIGQTGSGKSTLARLACALETPDAGRVLVCGVDTRDRRGRRSLRGVVGYVMQRPERQLFAETVADDVAYGPINLHLSASDVERRVRESLDRVGLADRADVSPFSLSGGQRRLCAIAGVLAMGPSVLVMDEPTAGLDPRGRSEVGEVVGSLRSSGVTVMQVTHSMEGAAAADRVMVLDGGRLRMAGTPDEVFSHEKELSACGLGIPEPLSWAHDLTQTDFAALGSPLTIDSLADAIAREVGTCR